MEVRGSKHDAISFYASSRIPAVTLVQRAIDKDSATRRNMQRPRVRGE